MLFIHLVDTDGDVIVEAYNAKRPHWRMHGGGRYIVTAHDDLDLTLVYEGDPKTLTKDWLSAISAGRGNPVYMWAICHVYEHFKKKQVSEAATLVPPPPQNE